MRTRRATIGEEDEDIDSLINDIQGNTQPTKESARALPKVNNQEQITECYPLFIGGSSLQGGMTQSSINPRSCVKLKCTDCDSRVIRFLDMQWKSNIDLEFLQTNCTNPLNLQKVIHLIINE